MGILVQLPLQRSNPESFIFSESPKAEGSNMVFGVGTRRKLFSGEGEIIDDSESPIKFSASPDEEKFQTPSFVEAYGGDDDKYKTSSVEKSVVRKRRGIK